MNNKNTIFLMVIFLCTMVAMLFTATYSYFIGHLEVYEDISVDTTIEGATLFAAFPEETIFLDISGDNMKKDDASDTTLAATSTGKINVTLRVRSDSQKPIRCTYDIHYKESAGSDKYVPSTAKGSGLKEFTMKATSTSTTGENKLSSPVDYDYILDENGLNGEVVTGAYIEAAHGETKKDAWEFTADFYNLDGNQNSLTKKNYSGNFLVTNVNCSEVDNG